jgi:hypothetical protein
MLGLNGGQGLAAMRRLDQPVSVMTQQRDQERPVGGQVVNDQNGRDVPPLSEN